MAVDASEASRGSADPEVEAEAEAEDTEPEVVEPPQLSFERRVRVTRKVWAEWCPTGTSQRWVVAVLVVAGAALDLLRRPTAISDPSLWAEDGTVFLKGQLTKGVGSITSPYAGYLHVIPRLVAVANGALPFRWTPWVYAVGAAFITSACCAVVLSKRMSWLVPTFVGRVALFVALILLPRVGEIHATLVNSIWFCGIGLLLLLLCDDPTTTAGRWAEGVAVAALVLTGLNGLILTPFLAVRWWRTRSRHTLVISGVWAVAAAIQGIVLVTSNRPVSTGHFPDSSLTWWGFERTMGPFFVSTRYVEAADHVFKPLPLWTAVILGIVIGLAVLTIVLGHRPTTAALFVGVGIVCIVASYRAMGPASDLLPGRYTAVPEAAALVGIWTARPRWPTTDVVKAFVVVWMIALMPVNFAVEPRDHLDWKSSADCVERARTTCIVQLLPKLPPGPHQWKIEVPPQR